MYKDKAIKKAIPTMPFNKSKVLTTMRAKVHSNITITSLVALFSLVKMGLKIAAIAITNKILAVLLPMIFPNAISGYPVRTASKDTVNSGKLVPKPITKALTNSLDNFNL